MSTALLCLATAIYFEARGENLMGQRAVAQVVINRVEDRRYPDTVCDVVWEPKQFSFTHDGKPEKMYEVEAREKAMQVAEEALQGNGLNITSTHYHSNKVMPYWKTHYKLDGRVGNHLFYTNKTPYK